MNALFSRLVDALVLVTLLVLLPTTAVAQIVGSDGTLGSYSTYVENSTDLQWMTVYSYVRHSDVAGGIVGTFMGEVLKPDPMWYEGLGGILSIDIVTGVPSIDPGAIVEAIAMRAQPPANDTITGKFTGDFTGKIDSIEDVRLLNHRGGTINNAYVSGIGTIDGKMIHNPGTGGTSAGTATLDNSGVINNIFIDRNSIVNNLGDAQIGLAFLYDGRLYNNGDAKIEGAYVLGGLLRNNGGNIIEYTTPTIENLYIEGGLVENQNGGAAIGSAFLVGGTLNNSNNATIDKINFTGGSINNLNGAAIGTASISDFVNEETGTVYTAGTVYLNRGGDGTEGWRGGDGNTVANPNNPVQGNSGNAGGNVGIRNDANSTDPILTSGTITTANVDSGILYSGIGGNGNNGGNGGNGGNAAQYRDNIFSGWQQTAGEHGSSGGNGGNGGDGGGSTITTAKVDGGILFNGIGGTGGNGGNGGNGGHDFGSRDNTWWWLPPRPQENISDGGTGGTGGAGGTGGTGMGTIITANVDSGALYNGFGGTGGTGGNTGGNGNGFPDNWVGGPMPGYVADLGGAGGTGGTGGAGGTGMGTIITANINGGHLYNGVNGSSGTGNAGGQGGAGFGRIETAYVNGNGLRGWSDYYDYDGGVLWNGWMPAFDTSPGRSGTGWIGTATVDGGFLVNNYGSSIDTVVILNNGLVDNGGIITDLVMYGGEALNDGKITSAAVNGGTLNNYYYNYWYDDGGVINNLTVNGGGVSNSGIVNNVTVNAGLFINEFHTISSMAINGGLAGNGAHINDLVYTNGSYIRYGLDPNWPSSPGTIGRLAVYGDSRHIDWGDVSELYLGSSGIVGNFTMSSGIKVDNHMGHIDNLTYNSGTYSGTGTIGTLNVAGDSRHIDWGNLKTVNVRGGGSIDNRDHIGWVHITGGALYNANNAYIDTVLSNNGSITNTDNAKIGTALVNSGQLKNGMLSSDATIDTMHLYGGYVDNLGYIGELNYISGTYAGRWFIGQGGQFEERFGTIGTLNISVATSYGQNRWGIVETANVSGDAFLHNMGKDGDVIIGNTLNLRGGSVRNWSHINEVNYTSGLYIGEHGTIGTLNVDGDARGMPWGNVEMVNVNSDGMFRNLYGQTITQATMAGGAVHNDGHIDNLISTSGTYTHEGFGSVGTANVYGGDFDNPYRSNSNIYFSNDNPSNATINTMNLSGGTVENSGRINEMTYTGGTYNSRTDAETNVWQYGSWVDGVWQDGHYVDVLHTGTIGTLTLAGDSANNTGDWGVVENLQFSSNGNGLLTISAFADESPSSFGIQAMSANPPTFSSVIQPTQSVDFTYGNIVLDMSDFDYSDDLLGSFFNAFGFDNGFFLDTFLGDMFGVNNVSGTEELTSFEVAFGGLDSFWIINDGDFTTDWTYNYDTGFVAYGEGSVPVVPEPATLAIIGLGLVGLGLARRRRK